MRSLLRKSLLLDWFTWTSGSSVLPTYQHLFNPFFSSLKIPCHVWLFESLLLSCGFHNVNSSAIPLRRSTTVWFLQLLFWLDFLSTFSWEQSKVNTFLMLSVSLDIIVWDCTTSTLYPSHPMCRGFATENTHNVSVSDEAVSWKWWWCHCP